MAPSKCLLLSSLPFELIEKILYKTPAESLIRLKWTCKDWYGIITNKKFMYNHLDHSLERFLRIDETIEIMDPVTGSCSVSPIPEEFDYTYMISYMVHCDGLMLCIFDGECICIYKPGSADLAVWNPALRKIKWIERRVPYRMTDYFGIGYDSTCRDNYKILRFSGSHILGDQEFDIYEFKSDSWRTIDAKFDLEVAPDCKGVSVKGNMYWIATKNLIVSFDFSVETFKNICCCPCSDWERRLLGCFNGDRICLLLQDHDSRKIEVWMTNKLSDGVVLFTKYLNVTSPNLPTLLCGFDMARPGYFIGKHRNIMAWCKEKVIKDDNDMFCTCYITLYDIDEGGVRRKVVTGEYKDRRYRETLIRCSYVYVPSLIPVPEDN